MNDIKYTFGDTGCIRSRGSPQPLIDETKLAQFIPIAMKYQQRFPMPEVPLFPNSDSQDSDNLSVIVLASSASESGEETSNSPIPGHTFEDPLHGDLIGFSSSTSSPLKVSSPLMRDQGKRPDHRAAINLSRRSKKAFKGNVQKLNQRMTRQLEQVNRGIERACRIVQQPRSETPLPVAMDARETIQTAVQTLDQNIKNFMFFAEGLAKHRRKLGMMRIHVPSYFKDLASILKKTSVLYCDEESDAEEEEEGTSASDSSDNGDDGPQSLLPPPIVDPSPFWCATPKEDI